MWLTDVICSLYINEAEVVLFSDGMNWQLDVGSPDQESRVQPPVTEVSSRIIPSTDPEHLILSQTDGMWSSCRVS